MRGLAGWICQVAVLELTFLILFSFAPGSTSVLP